MKKLTDVLFYVDKLWLYQISSKLISGYNRYREKMIERFFDNHGVQMFMDMGHANEVVQLC